MSFNQWKKYRLNDIAEFHNTKRIPLNSRERQIRKGNYPYYGASGIVDYIDNYIFDGDFVLISEDGENLRSRNTPIAFKVSGKFWVNNHAHIIRGKESFLNDWIVYFFQNLDLNPYITGAVQPKLSKENLDLIEIPIPEFWKAKKIVSILSALDDKIEVNRQTNATLEAIAQAIFKEWFVDFNFPSGLGFEGFGDYRDYAATRLSGESLHQANQGKDMVESELGLIPRGWRVGKVGEVCDVNKNMITKKDLFNWIDYIEISEVSRGKIGTITRYNYGEEPSRAKRKLKHGDTVLSTVRPNRGSYFLALNPANTTIVSTGFAVFSPQIVPFSFLYLLLTDAEKLEYYGHVADGGAYPAINPNLIMDIDLVIPPNHILTNFHLVIEPILSEMYQNEHESATLAQLRDSLLPKLMSGEIGV